MAPVGVANPCPSVGDAFIPAIWSMASVYTAAGIYILLATAALFVLFVELTSKKRRKGGEFKLRPIALSLIVLLCGLDGAFFFLLGTASWTVAPLYYFFSGFSPVLYCILLFLCMYLYGTIYYQVHFTSVLSDYEITVRQRRRAKIQLVVSIVAVCMQLIMYAMSFFARPLVYETVSSYVMGVVNLMAGVSFPLYMYYLKRKRALLESSRPRFQHRLLQCLTVTLLVAICAVLRGIVILSWSSVTPLMSRQVYWVWSACSYALFSQLPLAWLLVLFKVVSLESFTLVGTPDSEYWVSASPKSVAGHDFFLIDDEQQAPKSMDE